MAVGPFVFFLSGEVLPILEEISSLDHLRCCIRPDRSDKLNPLLCCRTPLVSEKTESPVIEVFSGVASALGKKRM